MPSFGTPKYNGTLSAPGFGRYQLRVIRLGYGKNVVTQPDGEARRFRTFYPRVATSGEWFIEVVFVSHQEMTDFGFWLSSFYEKLIDPVGTPLLPMTVSVNSRGFHKVGYPVATIDFGDSFGRAIWGMKLNFVSASEPTVEATKASKYLPPLRDSAIGSTMAPGGVQEPGYTPSPFGVGSVLTGYRR